jgi:hypothetical protein
VVVVGAAELTESLGPQAIDDIPRHGYQRLLAKRSENSSTETDF